MQSQKPLFLLLLLTLCSTLLMSCGGQENQNADEIAQFEEAPNDNKPDTMPPVGHSSPLIPWSNVFSNRINPGLAISGVKCAGNEVIEIEWRGDPVFYKCQQNQWLVVIDEKNVCDANGCTEIMVAPFVAELRLEESSSNSSVAHYYIRPQSPIDLETWRIVHRYWVKFQKSGSSQVVRRP